MPSLIGERELVYIRLSYVILLPVGDQLLAHVGLEAATWARRAGRQREDRESAQLKPQSPLTS